MKIIARSPSGPKLFRIASSSVPFAGSGAIAASQTTLMRPASSATAHAAFFGNVSTTRVEAPDVSIETFTGTAGSAESAAVAIVNPSAALRRVVIGETPGAG